MTEVAAAPLSGLSGPVDDNRRESSKLGNITSSKKRHLDANHTENPHRKHKRSKSDAVPAPSLAAEAVESDLTPKKKRKSHKSSKANESRTEQDSLQDKIGDDGRKKSKRRKTENEEGRAEKKKSKKGRKSRDRLPDDDNDNNDSNDDISTAQGQSGIVVLDSSLSTIFPSASSPSVHQYPFYTQTVSQYLPLHPLGINEPLQGYVNQHLEPLLNHYVPSLGGVLLSYRNPRVGEAPGESSLTQDSGIEDVALLEAVNEHAVSFGWLTVEISLFRPFRGAWLEGLVNIQSGGHIGVVCWGKFNASIEAERLPQDWKWVDQHSPKENAAEPRSTSPSALAQDDLEADYDEVHATGYWVDGQGSKITADTPIYFRIKNYEVGTSGDYGYLSIEGTMLTEEDEEEKTQKEREVQKRKLSRGIMPHRRRKPLLELGMTKFANDDGREPESQRIEI
ncbi:hypothetical protein F5Y09DRAFT_259571 [Xylaria sp. FL1042]|nr:hypothetical protein F5Y09DRAFT_259571 [Xylaria sp. FL1042]